MNACLGLGSNLGDRFIYLKRAIDRLRVTAGIEVKAISAVYESEPVGVPDQPNYLNAAVRVETSLTAKQLLKVCLAIEKSMGRVRTERWGSRNIDIDLLIYEDTVMSTRELTIPHPLLHEREFALRPLADIAPDLVHPVLFETVQEMLAAVEGTGGIRRLDDLDLTS